MFLLLARKLDFMIPQKPLSVLAAYVSRARAFVSPSTLPLRLISVPGRQHENKYFVNFLTELERCGAAVVSPSISRLVFFRYDVINIHFPTHHITENRISRAILLSLIFGIYLLVARILGRDVIYTVHDVVPLRPRHDLLLKRFLRIVHRLATAFVFLSASSRDTFVEHYPAFQSKPWSLAPHGPYDAPLMSAKARSRHRRQLGGGDAAFIVGFLGAIKPYKNIAALGQLPRRLPDGRAVHFVVAGRVEAGYEDEVDRVLGAIPAEVLVRIEHRLSDTDLNKLIQAVDIVLLPYVRGSNSGAALLVLSNHGRLVGSGLGIFRELAHRIGSPWVYSADPNARDLASCPGRSYSDMICQSALDQPDATDRLLLEEYLTTIQWSAAATAVFNLCMTLKGRVDRDVRLRASNVRQ